MTALLGGGRTDPGRVRSENQDRFHADPARGVFVVADGIAGGPAGALAAEVVVETLPRLLDSGGDAQPETRVRRALAAVSVGLREEAHGRIGREGMGAATVVALVERDRAAIGHLGDSRAYRLHGEELELLTRDHTLAELLVVSGRIEAAHAIDHPARHRLTRYVGMPGEPLPDVRSLALAPGDRLLLCSDGLPAMLPVAQLAAILAGAPGPQEASRRLIDTANEAGGEDNMTAVVIAMPCE